MNAGNRSTGVTLRGPPVLRLPHAPQPRPVGGPRRLGPGWQMPPRLYGQSDAEHCYLESREMVYSVLKLKAARKAVGSRKRDRNRQREPDVDSEIGQYER
ncbi:hypothetical protein EVAR_43389_1 [Eumeta japonica]|uniref:Uncharacterized protein n=1 Tax=Eumeta variegata TaxID=151549 RepID=A0A4C1WQ41_EUMVA|nr:hypothetical protein EVAR_43389_1 [Eumeta japonica]